MRPIIQLTLCIIALVFVVLSIFQFADKMANIKAENEHLREYCGAVNDKADRVLKMIEGRL